MKVEEVKHWRDCEILKPFFEINCCDEELGSNTTFGMIVDFLLKEVENRNKEILGLRQVLRRG